MPKRYEPSDFIGKTCGDLTVIDGYRESGYLYLICKCICGNLKEVRHSNFLYKKPTHCGCKSNDEIKNFVQRINKNETQPFKVGIAQKNNTTGCVGVDFQKHTQLYRVRINVKRKEYYLGSYSSKQQAIRVKHEAEKHRTDDFLAWFQSFRADKKKKKG